MIVVEQAKELGLQLPKSATAAALASGREGYSYEAFGTWLEQNVNVYDLLQILQLVLPPYRQVIEFKKLKDNDQLVEGEERFAISCQWFDRWEYWARDCPESREYSDYASRFNSNLAISVINPHRPFRCPSRLTGNISVVPYKSPRGDLQAPAVAQPPQLPLSRLLESPGEIDNTDIQGENKLELRQGLQVSSD